MNNLNAYITNLIHSFKIKNLQMLPEFSHQADVWRPSETEISRTRESDQAGLNSRAQLICLSSRAQFT